jgi:hypothetical protein
MLVRTILNDERERLYIATWIGFVLQLSMIDAKLPRHFAPVAQVVNRTGRNASAGQHRHVRRGSPDPAVRLTAGLLFDGFASDGDIRSPMGRGQETRAQQSRTGRRSLAIATRLRRPRSVRIPSLRPNCQREAREAPIFSMA